jgi:hypothetical protein
MLLNWLRNGILEKIPMRKIYYHLITHYRQANQCLLKVAQFAGTLEEYERAVDLYERVASKSLDNNLTKWSVRDYLFKAFICVLCVKVLW